MAAPDHHASGSDTLSFPDAALIEEMESIPEPALLYLPGGRVAAVNRAAARLTDLPLVGMTVGELLRHFDSRRVDGSPVLPTDLPCARALRGEHVVQGDRTDVTLPDGSVYRILATSTPVVADGKVVAALTVWHDFDEDLRRLKETPEPADAECSAEERRDPL